MFRRLFSIGKVRGLRIYLGLYIRVVVELGFEFSGLCFFLGLLDFVFLYFSYGYDGLFLVTLVEVNRD